MTLPIDPSFSIAGAEWSVEPVAPAGPAEAGGGDFAGALGRAVESLQADQQAATDAVQGMVTGTSADPTEAVMALERARLSMQLAAQIRTKGVEALQDIFHTQV
jgi:flagellar hook-basal body complex protein FliE